MPLLIISIISLTIWIYLITGRGGFWLCDQKIDGENTSLVSYPSICAIIPARNEAEVLPVSLKSLLNQDYPGQFSLILIDDQSTDNTKEIAQKIEREASKDHQLEIISGQPLPSGWTGKLWAVKQGIEYAGKNIKPDYLLLTDADIEHPPHNLQQLVSKAQKSDLALVSLMVLLRCQEFWEKLLIPSFIFFFQKLYPFPLVNNPHSKTAAAAGGCILIDREVLEAVGGIEVVKDALIDDCSLGIAIKSYLQTYQKDRSIWLGLSQSTVSLRSYSKLADIWQMVARTAFTQLNYSPWLLLGTVLAMSIIYLTPPLAILEGSITGNYLLLGIGFLTQCLMSLAYIPTLKVYELSPLWSLTLPLIGFLYTLMTIDSALQHWGGRGGNWKGRVYPKV
ncbi:MAG: hypothetical protein N5P05_003286 [Chroococcopsis gigantea SAG 12.99]|jgi:hopene-associated glycosyltransferase HpnB|nr:glycosyltransferase [Chlorogloea purpurea SAG 13.99]MDV3001680.1 hypothetical protein [Chroococcopsis gigantea SAG 12.99]